MAALINALVGGYWGEGLSLWSQSKEYHVSQVILSVRQHDFPSLY